MKALCNLFVSVIFILCVSGDTGAEQQESIIKDLEEIISQGKSASPNRLETVKSEIDKNPEAILPLLIKAANTTNLPDTDLAIYLWAIGLTKSQKAIDDVIRLSSGRQSEIVTVNAYRALANIGGDKSADYLLARLRETSDPKTRFNLLNLLAQLQYRAALPDSIAILALDPNQDYWQSVFIFGKYGDMAIPFLLERIQDSNKNIRSNAITVLGQWLRARAAVAPMKIQFWEEGDPVIRLLILSSLEKINDSLEDIRAFSQEVLSKERDPGVVQFAKETVNSYEQMNDYVKSFKAKKMNDRAVFDSEYEKLYASLGKEGDYDRLGSASTKADEQKLKKLKEIILQRNSDECFYDYQKINDIITLNRLIDS